jgi:hypothetical protein
MLPFGVTFPATVPQRSEIPEVLMNYPVYIYISIATQFYDDKIKGHGMSRAYGRFRRQAHCT